MRVYYEGVPRTANGRRAANEPEKADWLKVAGAVAGILAGIVAGVYVLGGLVLTVRLLSDGFSPDAVVTLLGQAPREFVVSTGLVEAIAPAALFGVLTALFGVLAALVRSALKARKARKALAHGAPEAPRPLPKDAAAARTSDDGADTTSSEDCPLTVPSVVGVVLLSVALTIPVVVLSFSSRDVITTGEWIACGVAFLVILPTVLGWWFLRRRLARHAREKSWGRWKQAFVYGALCAGAVLPSAVFTVGVIDFPRAQFCLEGTNDPFGAVSGTKLRLVTQTRDRTILAVDQGISGSKSKSILTVPTSKVLRLQAGDLGHGPLLCTGPL